jgi:hypothetical protein
MVRTRAAWAAGPWAIIWILGAAGVVAAETPAEDVLRSKGLKRSGSLYVLAAESKVGAKYSEARTRYESLREAAAEQAAFEWALASIRNLEAEGTQARNEIGRLQALLPMMPRLNQFEKQLYNQARMQLALLEVQQSERQATLETLTQGLPKPARRQEIKAEVESRLKTCQQAIRDLRQLVDATRKTYQEMARNGEIKQAIVTLARITTVNLKLGPSNDFLGMVDWLKQAEKSVKSVSVNSRSEPSHSNDFVKPRLRAI